MSMPALLRKKFDRSMEKLFEHTGPEALKPTLLVLREFRGLSNNSNSNQIDQYCANIFSVIKLAQRRFDNFIIPVGRHWANGSDPWTYVPRWLTLPSSRAWDSQNDVAFIQFAERVLSLMRLVRDLPFPDAARKNLSLLIRIKTGVYGASASPRHAMATTLPYQFQSDRLELTSPTHPNMMGAWLKEAKRDPEKWETSALARVHRLIDEEIICLLSIPEAMTWDISDEMARLIAAREEVQECSVVHGREAKCACHALFQPLIDRVGAMMTENRVNGAVTGRLPAEMVEEILSWSLLIEGNHLTVRDSAAAGGFRVAEGSCKR